jgi:hypothetical protein
MASLAGTPLLYIERGAYQNSGHTHIKIDAKMREKIGARLVFTNEITKRKKS